ncbi:MAG: LD-carboxypeptidase, partial [Armatimonadota bacterium]|nr:LD-carboxypeptidase [Armatimonadota bacterium]
VRMPSLDQFEDIVLITETSEEIPEHDYVRRVYRAFGERGILERVRAVQVGRPKAWEFDKPHSLTEKQDYRRRQVETTLATVRHYNASIPVVQNLDFGHTHPQICLPYGAAVSIRNGSRSIRLHF